MDFSDMKPFKNMVLEVAGKMSDCVQEMEESNVRTKNHIKKQKNKNLSLKILSLLTSE